MNDIFTRLARPTDAIAIAGIHADARRSAYRAMAPGALATEPSLGQRTARWRARLDETEEPSFTLLAARELEPAGFCAVCAPSHDSHPDGGISEISELYVAPEAWRTGVGTELVDTALARMRMAESHEVTAWVLASNDRALAFYWQFGFELDGAEARHDLTDITRLRLRVEL